MTYIFIMTMSARRRRLFTTACIAVILVAAAHTAGHLAPDPAIEADPEFNKLLATIDGYHAPLGMGMNPSFHDIHMGLVFTMTVSLLSLGVLGLAFASDQKVTSDLLAKFATLAAATTACMTGVYWVYQIPPPLVSLAIVTVLYAGSIRTTRA
jgi:hypothetical protein